MSFKDLNFKISIIGALHELGYYNDEADAIKDENLDWDEDYKPIPAMVEFYRNLKIKPEYLEEIEDFQPDGGDLCYQYLFNVWDGEDNQFDIKSIEGIGALKNLKSFDPISMIHEDGLDYGPILECKNLEFVNMEYRNDDNKTNDSVKLQLEKRGVEFEA